MELKNYFAQDDAGNILSGADCYLYMRGTENLVAGLLGANGSVLENPFSTDRQGLIQFAAANGLYDLRVVKGARDYRVQIQCNDVTDTLQTAESAADRAETAARGGIRVFGLYAEAQAESLPEGQMVEVLADETRDGKVSRFQVESGALVYKAYPYLTLEERLQDPTDASNGAGISAWRRNRLCDSITSAGDMLSAQAYSIWEFANLVKTKPVANDPLTWDWSPALRKAVEVISESTIPGMYASNIGHSGRVLSLANIPIGLSTPVDLPGGGHFTIADGYIFARSNFSSNYLMRMADSSVGFLQDHCTFRRLHFDSRYLCGGLLVRRSLRTHIEGCTFSRFNQNDGISVKASNHECIITGTTFGYKYWGNTECPVPEGTLWGYGVRFGSQDNRISDCVFNSGGGIYCGAQAQRITSCQFYSYKPYSGCGITVRTSKVNIIGCDFGEDGIWIYSPSRVIVKGCDFVIEEPTAASAAIRLIPIAAGEWMNGVVITGNDFNRAGGVRCKGIVYDTSQGTINRVQGSVIADNGFFGVDKTATRHTVSPYFNNVSEVDIDVSNVIPFGQVRAVNMSPADAYYADSVKTLTLRGDLSNQTCNSIKIKSSAPMRGNIMVSVTVEEEAA